MEEQPDVNLIHMEEHKMRRYIRGNAVPKPQLNPVMFTEPSARIGVSTLSINPRGTLVLNTSAVKEFKLQPGDWAQFGYDPDRDAVVIAFSPHGSPGASKLTFPKTGGARAQKKSFFNYFDLRLDQIRGRYNIHVEDSPEKGPLAYILLTPRSS